LIGTRSLRLSCQNAVFHLWLQILLFFVPLLPLRSSNCTPKCTLSPFCNLYCSLLISTVVLVVYSLCSLSLCLNVFCTRAMSLCILQTVCHPLLHRYTSVPTYILQHQYMHAFYFSLLTAKRTLAVVELRSKPVVISIGT